MTASTTSYQPAKLMFVVNDLSFFLSHRKSLAVAAKESGYHVGIACPEDPKGPALAAEGFTMLPIRMRRDSRSLGVELQTFWSVWRAIRQFKPDVLHLITSKPVIYGGLAARMLGIPSLSAISGLGYVFTGKSWRHKILKPAVTSAYGMAVNRAKSHVLFQNESDLGVFKAAGLLGKAQVSVIPGSGVDLDRIHPASLPDGAPVVLFPARMLRDKGVLEFAEAARLLRNQGVKAVFRLLGDPDPLNPTSLTRGELEAIASEGIVEWQPHTNEISAALAQAHLVVLPSYREGFPKTLIDAAAAGRAAATSDVPGCRDAIVPGETGALFKARDASDLARVIGGMLADTVQLDRMGAAARRHAEATFDIRSVVRRHLTIYGDLLLQGRDDGALRAVRSRASS